MSAEEFLSKTTFDTEIDEVLTFDSAKSFPVLLVAYSPPGTTTVDRVVVGDGIVAGRSFDCDLTIRHRKVSKRHFRIFLQSKIYFLEDLGSTNGIIYRGARIEGPQHLTDGFVFRAGPAVMVFHSRGKDLIEPPQPKRYGLAGRFHVVEQIRNMREASMSSRHVLVTGPSGSGKELTARGLAEMMGNGGKPLRLVTHNCARFSSEEEAATTLFGVAKRVFSSVDARPGLIESAEGGALFLDEIHNLPDRVQRSLLRVVEDGTSARIGETSCRKADVHFILATNESPPHYGLAPDLLARLRVVHVPPLSQRPADVPTLFDHLVAASCRHHGIDEEAVLGVLKTDHYEALCLDGFKGENVRGLFDLADRITTRIAAGTSPGESISTVFSERFSAEHLGPAERAGIAAKNRVSSSSHYDRNKERIVEIIKQSGGNLSATERRLKEQGFRCSRRWLAHYAVKWGLKSK